MFRGKHDLRILVVVCVANRSPAIAQANAADLDQIKAPKPNARQQAKRLPVPFADFGGK